MIRRADGLAPGPLRADVCVIGSGAGGAVCASKLAEHGLDVVMVEEGEHHRAEDMTQDELEMIPRLFQDGGRRTTHDQSIMVMQGRALGGSTTHNTGLCVPVGEATWRRWERGAAVPVPWEELAPYLDGTLQALEARVADGGEINENNRILREGAERLGLSHVVARHNRRPCSGCGFCTLGCAYNRKVSVVHGFLPAGVAAGLRIVTGFRADVIEGEGAARRVRGVTAGGVRLDVQAPAVVVAAGAVHTPILLRRSGLANRRIGRGLRLHPFAPVGALFRDEIVAWRGVPQSIIIDDRADRFLLMVAAAQPAVAAVMTPGLGRAHRELMLSFRRLAAAGVLVHDTAAGRVRAGRDGRPVITYWPSRADQAAFREGIKLLARLYFEMGAERVVLPFARRPLLGRDEDIGVVDRLPFRRHEITLGSVHPQGTCPMGMSSADSVTDGRGAVHGARGVWVADTSLFPSSLGLPPQVTTMALAWCVADHVHAARDAIVA